VRLLLDTHTIVWWLCAPEVLSRWAFAAIGERDNEVLVSAACGYEIEIKRDRDEMLRRVPERLYETVLAQGFTWLPIGADHAISAALLPMHHRDPWDRILIAQAMDQVATLVTRDVRISAYDVSTLW
jgi:PIN domain nuclease of toxin-antitoxin system